MHIFLRNNSAKSKCENVLVFQIVRDCIELRFLKVHLFIRRFISFASSFFMLLIFLVHFISLVTKNEGKEMIQYVFILFP